MSAGEPGHTEKLRALEESLWRAETRYDPIYMERILTPDFVEFGRSGRVYSKADCLVFDSTQKIDAIFPFNNFSVAFFGETGALVTYISALQREGHEGIERSNRSSLWLITREGWRLRFHQGTPC